MKTKIGILLLIVAVLVLGSSSNTIAIPANYYVDGTAVSDILGNGTSGNPWKTIQYAINSVFDGDIIHVAAGTYNESVTIDKGLALLGPNYNVSPITGTRVAEAVWTGVLPLISLITNNVSGVTIQGFKFVGTSNTTAPGVIHSNKKNVHYVTIRSNIFSGSDGRSIFTTQENTRRNVWLITDNVFENMNRPFQAAMMVHSLENSTISNNLVRNTTYGGIQIGYSINCTISGNHVENVPRSGIQVANSSDITIKNNTIINAGNGGPIVNSGGTNQTDDPTENGGITLYNADQTNIVVKSNILSGNFNGVTVRAGAALGAGILVQQNNITGSVHIGIDNLAPGMLNAEYNWWGDNDPSNNVSGFVDYIPFLDSSPVIPTLNEWGIIIMLILLAGAGMILMRRRQRTVSIP